MSIDCNQQVKFESMSNELLMKIFQYYDLYLLFFSFGSLNCRIDNILYHCQGFVNLDCIQPYDFVDFLSHTLCRINPKNIRSLYASKSHQIEVLAYDKSLIHFTYIRSLTLYDSQRRFIDNILSRIHFVYLERVLIINCKVSESFRHFFDTKRYPNLRTYHDYNSIPDNVTSMLPIEYLSMGECTPQMFFDILQQSSNLKHVSTSLVFTNATPELNFLSPTPQYNTLTHLNITYHRQCCMKTLDYLFKCLPRLYALGLMANVAYQIEHIEPIFWERFLTTRCIKLKRLQMMAFMHEKSRSPNPVWHHLLNEKPFLEQIEKSNYWSQFQREVIFHSSEPTYYQDGYSAKFMVL